MTRWLWRGGGLSLLLGIALACSGNDQGGAGPEADDARAAPAARSAAAEECVLSSTYGSVECDSCLTARCCVEIAACSASAECTRVLGCASACVGTAEPTSCLSECFEGGSPPEEFLALDDCAFASCESACFE